MNASDTPPDEPTTEWEFQRALTHLVLNARENGIDVRGGWMIDDPDESTDFGVEIYRVVKDRSTVEDATT